VTITLMFVQLNNLTQNKYMKELVKDLVAITLVIVGVITYVNIGMIVALITMTFVTLKFQKFNQVAHLVTNIAVDMPVNVGVMIYVTTTTIVVKITTTFVPLLKHYQICHHLV
jgi:phosphoribosyl-dephospho-CoA transferase